MWAAKAYIVRMSRAFVNEDSHIDALPDRPVSEHPNLVTSTGLALIEAALEAARRAYAEAQAEGDRDRLASAGRDLRYWNARRATAQLRSPESGADAAQFGHTISIERDDGRRQTFRIVGEDEADPAKGSISYVSPLARSLLGRRVGDVVHAGRVEAEIVEIK